MGVKIIRGDIEAKRGWLPAGKTPNFNKHYDEIDWSKGPKSSVKIVYSSRPRARGESTQSLMAKVREDVAVSRTPMSKRRDDKRFWETPK